MVKVWYLLQEEMEIWTQCKVMMGFICHQSHCVQTIEKNLPYEALLLATGTS